MENSGQSLSNHTRNHPPFHFFLLPVVFVHLVWSGIKLYRAPSFDTVEGLLLALGLVVMAVLTRVNPLRAQDRLIRLEERLRYQKVLPAALAEKASAGLTEGQMVALRFASDGELAGLVQEVLDGKLVKGGDIKKAIQHWRGDYFRV